MRFRDLTIILMLWFIATRTASATTYNLPENPDDNVITQYPDNTVFIRAKQDETLLDIALRFSLGQMEIVHLNQKVDRWLVKKGEVVRLANRRILPDTPHRGIVLNLSEYRLYYYPNAQPDMPAQVMSYATGIGRQDWRTPLGYTRVSKKVRNPSWYPPESIRREHARNDDPLPRVVPPGPHNPLGAYALYLALRGYLIHGTDIDKIYGIGMQITHGCVRMYPNDIEELYYRASVGTPVYIVKQPIKVGWLNSTLYIEAHPDLEGVKTTFDQRHAVALRLIKKATQEELPAFNQEALDQALQTLDGDPVPILQKAVPQETAPIEFDNVTTPYQ
ncbi:L,D-transpeptidase family protein [Methylobacter psychrophilus]|uniref:L,D-transpeptidase family protein n=1 Tax=Methylobacter psychrophilus TaxID=96941 RepID=UPI0021D4B323|nr:L,D-transpeptidase family protein [Methylobacter psychrophilus]